MKQLGIYISEETDERLEAHRALLEREAREAWKQLTEEEQKKQTRPARLSTSKLVKSIIEKHLDEVGAVGL